MSAPATDLEDAPVLHRLETGSTNEDALVAGRSRDIGPLWIRADRQLTGRGRHGRVWHSPVGNLYCSLLFASDAPLAKLPQLSHVAAVGLVEAIQQTVGPIRALHIKWPNDLLVGDAKVAGILVEGTQSAGGRQLCVIGCGVNCQWAPEQLSYPARSLTVAAGRPVSPDDLFDALRGTMPRAIAAWNEGRGYASIRQRWLAHALALETPLSVTASGRATTGRFQGIDEDGRLLLLGPAGPITIEAGEVLLT